MGDPERTRPAPEPRRVSLRLAPGGVESEIGEGAPCSIQLSTAVHRRRYFPQ